MATSNNVGLLPELDEPVAYLRVPANTTTSVMMDGISFVYEPVLKPIWMGWNEENNPWSNFVGHKAVVPHF